MLRHGLGRLLHHARQVLLGAFDRKLDLLLGSIPAGTGDGVVGVRAQRRMAQHDPSGVSDGPGKRPTGIGGLG